MRKILKILSATTVSNLIFAFSQWLLLVILIKWGTTNDVGNYMYGLALTAPVIMLVSLKYENFIQTQELLKEEIQALFSIRLMLILLTTFIFLGYIAIVYDDIDFLLVIGGIWIFKSLELIIQFNYSLLVHSNKITYLNRAKIRRSIATFITASTIFYCTEDLFLMIVGMNIYLVLDLLIFTHYFKSYNFFHFDSYKENINKLILKKYIVAFIPFGLSLFLVSINANTSRYLGEYYYGTEFVGFFTSISYFIIVGNMLINAVFSISSYKMKLALKNDFSKFLFYFRVIGLSVFGIGFLGILVAYILNDQFLVLIYSSDYKGMEKEFVIVMATGFFLYMSTYLQHVLSMLNKLNIQFIVVLIGLLSQILSFFLLKDIGTLSVYLAYMISMFVTFTVFLGITFYYVKEEKRCR